MKTLLKSTYSCLIKTDTQTIEMDKNDVLEIENEKFVFIYPENQGMSFYINLLSGRENKFYSLIKKENQLIYLLEPLSNIQIESKKTLNVNGIDCQIFTTPHKITFQTPTKKVTYRFTEKHEDCKIFKHKNFACAQYDDDFYAFLVQKNKLYHLQGDDLVFEDGKISVTKKYHDSIDRERVLKYSLNDNFSIENENHFSKINTSPKELLAYQFMESIKARDYAFAKKCLSKDLDIDEEQLKEFFGNILQFLPLSKNEYISLTADKKSYVTFVLSNDMIVDISIDTL